MCGCDSSLVPPKFGALVPLHYGVLVPLHYGVLVLRVTTTGGHTGLFDTLCGDLRCPDLDVTCVALSVHGGHVCWLVFRTHLSQVIGALAGVSEFSVSRYTVSIGWMAVLGNSSLARWRRRGREGEARMIIGKVHEDQYLTEAETREVFRQSFEAIDIAGKKLLVIIPDGTRSAPIPLCFRLFTELLKDVVTRLDFLIALGTHKAMDEEEILRHTSITAEERAGKYADVGLFNHDWRSHLRRLGTIPAAEIVEATNGLMEEDVSVEINERVFEYDHVMICGPVFPHEVVGFSGGNKYFFPGISGAKLTGLTHWLAGLITNLGVIGREDTPVRRVIDRAATLIKVPRSCFSMVVEGHGNLVGIYFGSPEESQAVAARLSARVNVRYLDRAYHTVLAVMPELYDDFWTACKGMFKSDPVVADGGRLIIYAPHIDQVSYTHGQVLDRIGYHLRDYYLSHMDELRDVSRVVMGHAALVKGAGSYENGVEKPRISVVLATGIPRERCEQINLGYMDPATIDPDEWAGREDEGILVVPRAGEILYRLKE